VKWLPRKLITGWRSFNDMQRACVRLWLYFSVLLGFAPIPIAWFVNMFNKGGNAQPVRHGDVFLLASALCFIGLAAMFRPRNDDRPREMSGIAAGTLVLGIADIVLYTAISSASQRHDLLVDVLSALLYVGSALCSLGCTVVAEEGAS
jgi:hypothetical protein